MKKDKLTLIGKALFDFYGISYDFLPSTSNLTKEIVENYLEAIKRNSNFYVPGGCMLNVAKELVNSKRKVSLVGSVGNDELGKKYKSYIKKNKINSCLKTIKTTTGITVNSLRGKSWYYYGASDFGDLAVKEYSEEIRKSDRIIIDAYFFASTHKFLLETLEESSGKKYLILSGSGKEEFREKYFSVLDFLKKRRIKFDIIFGNFKEWDSLPMNLVPETDMKVITYPWGCKVIEKNKETKIVKKIMPVEKIHTIGAGDAFAGTFISFYIDEYPIKECAKEACKASVNKIKNNLKNFWKNFLKNLREE